jgi:diguanylate cyclase
VKNTKNQTCRQAAAGLPPESIKSMRSPTSAGLTPITKRETVVLADEKSVVSREKLAAMREEVVDLREESADRREKTLRDQGGASREKAARAETQLREANENLVIAAVHAQTMADAAEQAAAQISHMAQHDSLAGLPNRALLSDRLALSIALAQLHDKKVALLHLDLDHFKHVNDSLGQAVGDKLLQSVAKRLQACIRPLDTVSRQGGDEFLVLLSEVENSQDADVIAEKLIQAMGEPHLLDEHRLHVTLSIGVSLYPEDGKDAESVLKNADIAMYHAKKSGHNQYQAYTPGMNVCALAVQSVEQALHHALDRREFVLHYQPKVNLETGAITSAEALLRWQRSEQQLESPMQFVSIAENCGLILSIGKWVLREACRQAHDWLQAGLRIGHIAVNVSAIELQSKGFLAGVSAILTDTGLDPCHLELELTESGLMQDMQLTTVILQEIRDLGVRVAIDDFGTGYSSLRYLQRFPVNTIKIDQSFVQDIGSETGQAIVSAIIAMSASLKLRVVAEGIETQQQLAFLLSHRCAEGQGHYFSRPVPAEEFATLIAANSL